MEVLLADGVDALTVDEIAARSGVAKSTIYRHFGSRDDLLVEAARSCLVELPTPDTGSLADDLADLFSRFDASPEHRRLNDLFPFLLDAGRRDPDMRTVVDSLIRERQRPIRTVLKLAQGRGEIDPDLDLDLAVAMLIGPFTYRHMVQGLEIDDAFIAAVLPGGVAALRSTAGARS